MKGQILKERLLRVFCSMILQAFVLGAGLGKRLRPLTEEIPKPLVPVFQKPLITFALDHLAAAGVKSFVINTHHLPAPFETFFTDGAYRTHILVVRGSLDNPETFRVNAAETLRGLTPDFVLKPRDIVYVARKPWAIAQDLLQAAQSDFLRAAVVTWTGQNIGSFSQ